MKKLILASSGNHILKFTRQLAKGTGIYFPTNINAPFSVIKKDGRYYIRIRENDAWHYPAWDGIDDGFRTITDATSWLNNHDWENATTYHIEPLNDSGSTLREEFIDAMNSLGFSKSTDDLYGDIPVYETEIQGDDVFNYMRIRAMCYEDGVVVDYWINGKRLSDSKKPKDTSNIKQMMRSINRMIDKFNTSQAKD